MNAEEARLMTNVRNKNQIPDGYLEVLERIKERILEGFYKVTISHKQLTTEIKATLIANGFSVNDKYETIVEISW